MVLSIQYTWKYTQPSQVVVSSQAVGQASHRSPAGVGWAEAAQHNIATALVPLWLHLLDFFPRKMFDVFSPVKALVKLDEICIDNNIFRLHYKVSEAQWRHFSSK